MYLSQRFAQQVIAHWIVAAGIIISLAAGSAAFLAFNGGALSFSRDGEQAVTLQDTTHVEHVRGPYELYMTAGTEPVDAANAAGATASGAGEQVSGPWERYMTQAPPMNAANVVAPEVAPAAESVSGPCDLYMIACSAPSNSP